MATLSISSMFTAPLTSMLRSALTAVLKAIVPALTVSTSLFNGGVYDTWCAVLVVSYAISSLFLIAIAYSYLTGRALGHFRGTTGSLTNLSITLVLMPFTLFICQLLLDVNDAMTSFVIPYSHISSYSSMVTQSLGGYSLFTLLILSVVVALLYLMLVVRVLLVFFLASLMPILCLCYSLEWTRSFAEKMISLLIEMSFLPFFVSVALRIGISASYSTIHSLQVVPLIIAGTYLLPLMIPFIMSPGGSRILQYMGLPPVSAVITGAIAVGVGAAASVTGRIAPPFKSALSRSGPNRSAAGAGSAATKAIPRKSITTGIMHSSGMAQMSAGIDAKILPGQNKALELRVQKGSSYVKRVRARVSENKRVRPHKIYPGKDAKHD
ncbi:MAG: hypothetical protein KIS30_07110 [Thermoplasmata archaeon]|nr:hypothetical protein [Candidatus Sysuiplasma acidicola]MBX8646507.1 hypothetical protein [Candidatus Sysuiplasma acidicola]